MQTRSKTLVLLVLLALAAPACSSCATTSAPASLSPVGAAAFQATRVVQSLDLLRDAAIAANAQTPPLLSEATTRKVVIYHRSAVTMIGAVPSGWGPTVSAGLVELERDLPTSDRPRVAPYIALAKVLIAEVSR